MRPVSIFRYFEQHFPKAIETGQQARAAGKFTFRWMTQSWLVDMYRHCNDSKINIHGPAFPSMLRCPVRTLRTPWQQQRPRPGEHRMTTLLQYQLPLTTFASHTRSSLPQQFHAHTRPAMRRLFLQHPAFA